MGWAFGLNHRGEEIGYGVEAFCMAVGCEAEIDKGLAFCCGGLQGVEGFYGCGAYFCDHHLFFGHNEQLCEACWDRELNAWRTDLDE
jgi:hypothetical protein